MLVHSASFYTRLADSSEEEGGSGVGVGGDTPWQWPDTPTHHTAREWRMEREYWGEGSSGPTPPRPSPGPASPLLAEVHQL